MDYLKLCELLEVKPTPNQKNRHIKKLQEKYNINQLSKNDYEYLGQLSTLEIIKNTAGVKKDRLYLEPMIYTKLLNTNNNLIELKMKDLLLMFGLVNASYYPVKYNIDEATTIVDIVDYASFIEYTEPILKRIVYEVLIDMKDKLLIDLEFIPHGIRYERINNSKKSYPVDYNLKDNKDIYETYLNAYYNAMESKGYKRQSKIKWFDIMPIREMTALAMGYNWIYFQYKITINRKSIQEYITNDFYGMKHDFNYYIQNKIKRNNRDKYKLFADDDLDLLIDMLINDRNIYKFDERLKELRDK